MLRLIYVTVTEHKTQRCHNLPKRKTESHAPRRKKGGIFPEISCQKSSAGDARSFVRLMEINKQSMYKIARSYFTSDEDIADAIQIRLKHATDRSGILPIRNISVPG